MLVLEVNTQTLFVKFDSVYPECEFLIRDQPQLRPLMCLDRDCHRQMNCMEKLAKRVLAIFDAFPSAKLMILYFKYRDAPSRVRGGVFWRDMREPRNIILNPGAWSKMKSLGTVYDWELPLSMRLGG